VGGVTVKCCCGQASSSEAVADVPSAGSPPVEAAEELAVWALLERLAVLRARDWGALPLVPGVFGSLSENVDELVPGASGVGDDSSSAVSPAATLAPP
jgi:hypothetical protein